MTTIATPPPASASSRAAADPDAPPPVLAVAQPRRPGVRELGVLLLLVLAAVALRAVLADRSLWLDELITVLKAKESMPALLDGLADDVHPPLYYVLLHWWVDVAGETPAAVRALSVGWSAIGVVAVWGWAREAFPLAGGRAALPAAALAALTPFAAWYGSEARMYAQVLALTALAGWAAWRLLGRGPSRLRVAALGVCLIALAWTHFFASLFLGGLGVVALILAATRPQRRTAAAWVMASCAVAVASLLPWAAWVLQRRSEVSPDPTRYPEPDFYSVVIAAGEMLVGFQSFDVLGLFAAGWPLLGLLAILLLPRMAGVSWRSAGLLALSAIPTAVLVGGSIAGPRSVFDPRFLAVCAIPLYLLVGRLVAADGRSARGWRLAGAAVLVAVAVAGAARQNSDLANPKLYDYEGAIQRVNDVARPGDAVLLLPNFEAAGNAGEPVFDYYPPKPGVVVADTRAVGQVSADRTRKGILAVWSQLGRQRPARLFVIDAFATHNRGRRAARAVHRFLADHGQRVSTRPFAHATVHVYNPDWGTA